MTLSLVLILLLLSASLLHECMHISVVVGTALCWQWLPGIDLNLILALIEFQMDAIGSSLETHMQQSWCGQFSLSMSVWLYAELYISCFGLCHFEFSQAYIP